MTTPNLRRASPRSEPDLPRLVRKAVAAHQDGDFSQADRLYRMALQRDPANFQLLHLIGTLAYQRGRLNEALRFLTAAVERNPRSAEALSDLGLAQHVAGRYDDALASQSAALAIEPDNPDLINRRAVALLRLGRPEDALAELDRMRAIAPDHVDGWGNRGNVLVRLNRPEEAIAAYDIARRIAGDTAQVLTNRAHALRRLDRIEEAIADLREALALRPDFAEAHFELGMAQLALGDYAEGWNAYEWRWATAAFAPSRRTFTSPLWTGEQAIAGKTVLLHAEQGFGDTIQFVRYAPLVARLGATVILEVQPELVSLVSEMKGLARVIAHGDKLPRFDLHCPLMSLPRAFRTQETTIPADVPYLGVPAPQAYGWAQRLPPNGPLVGIAWAGRRTHHNDHNRSVPLARLAPALRQSGMRFVSLQRDLRAGDSEILRGLPNMLDPGAAPEDFADTAALISRLDAVISVDTAVAHLAGALGKPLYLLLPHAADFRWLRGRDDSAWYPSARLLRQPAPGDWESVTAQLVAQLSEAAATGSSAYADDDAGACG
jgi:tetratricopeptide (TPR) repeat protein